MKRIAFLIGSVFVCLFLFGCRAVEPEEVYLVSALGFDKTASGIRLVAEVPLTRENEADKMEVRLFEGEGGSIPSALEAMKAGLSKQLEFGHCALAVLGDGIEDTILDEALRCLSDWEIPLSATVIYSPDARTLLEKGSVGAPAVGYEIPDTLRLIAAGRGEAFRCRVYEIASSGGNFTIPQFLSSGEKAAEVDRFEGTRVYQNKKAVIAE